MRNKDVTTMIIIEAVAWVICGAAAMIAFVKWVG
jgi:hypothetical protein